MTPSRQMIFQGGTLMFRCERHDVWYGEDERCDECDANVLTGFSIVGPADL